MALRVKMYVCKASLAIDTVAAVNVLSEKTYKALKYLCGGRYLLRSTDLSLCGVPTDRLNILGVVRLPVSLGRNTPVIRLDFYVESSFSLPPDGLLGLSSLRSKGIIIVPDSNTVKFQERCFKAMDQPVCLASSWTNKETPSMGRESISPETKMYTVPNLSAVPVPDTGATGRTPTDIYRGWKSVNMIVMGNREIPQRTAMHIPVSVPNATVGCDLCLKMSSRVNMLAIEFTFNTVCEGGRTVALVVNTTGGPVKLRKEVFLFRALAFDGQVLPEPLELKHTPVGAVNQPCAGDKTSQASSLGSFLKVGDYPELKGSLLKLLHQYRDVIALPGESLGTTDTTEHKIRVKFVTKPVYISAYRLSHSQ